MGDILQNEAHCLLRVQTHYSYIRPGKFMSGYFAVNRAIRQSAAQCFFICVKAKCRVVRVRLYGFAQRPPNKTQSNHRDYHACASSLRIMFTRSLK
jgi:hypothetical protein